MKRRFFYFLVTVQLIILLAYWIWYEALTVFLPDPFLLHQDALQTFFTVMAFAFLAVLGIGMFKDHWLLRLVNRIVMTWAVVSFYGFWASAVVWIAFVLAWILRIDLPMHVFAAVMFSLALLTALASLINARIHRVRKISVSLPNLPDSWQGKSLVLLTDVHVGHILRHGFVRRIVDMTNGLNPEAVLISGDYYDGVHTDADSLAAPLVNLKAPLGAYFVSGNHDSYRELDQHIAALAKAGVKIIDNKFVDLGGLMLVGEGYDAAESVDSLKSFLKNLSFDRSKPSILLKHVPNNLSAAAEAGISLTLSGHTHKGQLWPGSWITKKVFSIYHSGLQKLGNMLVYTSSGVGTWGPPAKLGSKSEIVQIELKKK